VSLDTKQAPPAPTKPQLSHARDLSRPGFYVKLVLMMLVNALGLYGILASYGQQEWGVLVFLVLALIVVDYVYFSKRAVPAKYLVPGLLFLIVFQIYVMANTAYVAFTNYGDGHNDAKEPAITQIMKTSDRRVEGTQTYPVTVLDRDGEVAFAIIQDGSVMAGDAETPLESVEAEVLDGRIHAVDGADVDSPLADEPLAELAAALGGHLDAELRCDGHGDLVQRELQVVGGRPHLEPVGDRPPPLDEAVVPAPEPALLGVPVGVGIGEAAHVVLELHERAEEVEQDDLGAGHGRHGTARGHQPIGSAVGPRNSNPLISTGPARARSGRRSKRRWTATRTVERPSHAPRHTCAPVENAMWGPSLRWRS